MRSVRCWFPRRGGTQMWRPEVLYELCELCLVPSSGPWLCPGSAGKALRLRPAHRATTLAPPRPQQEWRSRAEISSADRKLHKRGAGPAFLLL